MILNEAIERYTSNAEYERIHGNLQGCLEFRQLAEWLKDYKRLLEQEPCEDWYDVPSDEMTIEQARQAVKDLRKKLAEHLEQEPCDDAVSREELLKAMDTWDKFGFEHTGCFVREPKDDFIVYVHYDDMVNCVKGMLPVNPQPKTGHWIEHPTEEDYSVCSRCGIGCKRMEHGKNADGTKYIDIYSYNFCPYCGARMIEPQERSGEE